MLLHTVLMGLVVWDMVSRQQDFMQRQLAHQGGSLARTLALNAPSWLISNDLNGLRELVESLKTEENLRLALILDRQGKVRASTDPGLLNLVLDDPDTLRLLAGNPQQIWHENLVDSAARIVVAGESIGHARVMLDATPVRANLSAVTQKGVAYTLLAILVGGLIAWLAVRRMTQRLARLSTAADHIAAGDYAVELPDDLARDEVARLTRDFAQMTRALREDIRRRNEAETRLFAEKERAQVTLASIGDAVITTDVTGRVEFINAVAEQLTGWSNAEAAGHPLDHIFHIVNETSRIRIGNPVETVLKEGVVVGLANHTMLIRRDGAEFNIEDSAAPIRDKQGRIIGVVLVFHDVTHAHAMAKRVDWAATHDALTGIANRSEFERRLEALVDRPDAEHALLYIDLDQFKVVNDTCGHTAGDQMLCQITALLQTRLRDADTLARLGGDEFGVLLEHCSLEAAHKVAESLLESLATFRFAWDGKPFQVGASIGLVPIEDGGMSAAQLMAAADTACYAAKDAGRNRVRTYHAADDELTRRTSEMSWVSRINRAIDESQLLLYWQPVISLSPQVGEAVQGEILLRMLDDAGHIVNPGTFLPAAERYHLMLRIDRWVVHQSLKWLMEHPEDLRHVAINLSGQSIGDAAFLDDVVAQVQQSGIAPPRICFEITETAAIAQLTHARRFIEALRSLGCRFSLDDFGSGLSSFGYLKNLPVDFLKIDGSFVRNILRSPIDEAMVASINHLGHVMGLATIAEFVENEDIRQRLQELGINYAQGYAIAAPAPLQ
ncbi:MAG: EAL domain-containing protein [Betaproteobacteria bacterium]|nr:EAL domain-containing protein [Betaproteobacteria bacterium]